MMKLIATTILFVFVFNAKAVVHTIYVWEGYFQFTPGSITIDLGDTIQWLPLGGIPPTMVHTVTSSTIPPGAATFDYTWQAPSDTFFQYVPTVAGIYDYVCTPHISMNMVGQFTVNSTGTSISNKHTNSNELLVYPNPTNNIIRLVNNNNSYPYKLYSFNGQVVSEGIFKHELDISSLANGLFILELITDQRKRIIVEKW